MDGWEESIEKYGHHIEHLRKKILTMVKLFLILFFAGVFLVTPAIRWLLATVPLPNVIVATTSPFQFFDMAMSGGFLFATLMILPLFGIIAYRFLKPALTKNERRLFLKMIPVILLLFIIGFAYGLAVLSFAITMIAQVNTTIGITNIWDIGKFISEVVTTSVLLGIIFQFPVVLTGLIRLGFLRASFLKEKRRHAFLAIVVFVALLPPTDGVSLLLMAVPMILIYEVTIFINSSRRR